MVNQINETPLQLVLRTATNAIATKDKTLMPEWDEILAIELMTADSRMEMPMVLDYVNRGLIGRFFKAFCPTLLEYVLEKAVSMYGMQPKGEEDASPEEKE